MKSLGKVIVSLTLATSALTASAQLSVVTFDENGSADLNGTPLPASFGADPSGGIAGNVLIYTLPFLVNPGDVGLSEPSPVQPTAPSDLVRFFTIPGTTFSEIIFYSDRSQEPNEIPDLADTGLPISSALSIIIPEIGPEGNNGAVWIPGATDPGFMASGGSVQYNILSDVPEPSSMALIALGLGLASKMTSLRRNRLERA